MKLLSNLTIQLFLSIIAAMMLGEIVGAWTVSLFYSVSTLFIDVLMLFLPFIVFIFVAAAIIKSGKGAFFSMLFILLGVTASNILAIFTSFLFAKLTLPNIVINHGADFGSKFTSSVSLLFKLSISPVFGTEKALLTALIFGSIYSIVADRKTNLDITKYIVIARDGISTVLSKIFIPVLPLYVFGFCLKLSYDGALVYLISDYGKVFLLSMTLVVCYVFAFYFIASGFSIARCLNNIKTFIPAGLTGFSTMSSAATMPVTLSCAEKALRNKNFADICVPSTANIHMIGDDLTITMTAMTLMSVFGMPWPSLSEFFVFAFAFSIAKLSCVGIPGASVLVILPVLQTHLGFTPEMITIATTIYILQDAFGTAANVMSNGAFSILMHKILNIFRKSIRSHKHENI